MGKMKMKLQRISLGEFENEIVGVKFQDK